MEIYNAFGMEDKEKDEEFMKPINEHLEKWDKMSKLEKLQFDCDRKNKLLQPIYDSRIYNCPICNNSGYRYAIRPIRVLNENGEQVENDAVVGMSCECMKVRAAYELLAKSGLTDRMKNLTFANYKTKYDFQSEVKAKAEHFISSPSPCFYIGGFTGSGKTFICTAIVNKFLEQMKSSRYVIWADFISSLKADFGTADNKVSELQTCDVLYIDDLFKFEPTKFEKDTLYRIINYRTNANLKTIISSECKLLNQCKDENYTKPDLMGIDLAVAGRIYENSNNGEFVVQIPNKMEFNCRFKKF